MSNKTKQTQNDRKAEFDQQTKTALQATRKRVAGELVRQLTAFSQVEDGLRELRDQSETFVPLALCDVIDYLKKISETESSAA